MVHGYEGAVVTLLAVIATDLLVFWLGRIFGRRIIQHHRMVTLFSPARLDRVNGWVKKYGNYAVFIFRFTPGIRFPAHIILGMSKIQTWQFALIDGMAAMISVPTQILLIYHFGEPILKIIHEFRDSLFYLVGALLVVFFFRKLIKPWFVHRRSAKLPLGPDKGPSRPTVS